MTAKAIMMERMERRNGPNPIAVFLPSVAIARGASRQHRDREMDMDDG